MAILRSRRLPDLEGHGDLARSVCTVTCKWTFLAHEDRWDPSYFDAVGLSDLAEDGFGRIGARIVEAGAPLGSGLSAPRLKTSALWPASRSGPD